MEWMTSFFFCMHGQGVQNTWAIVGGVVAVVLVLVVAATVVLVCVFLKFHRKKSKDIMIGDHL